MSMRLFISAIGVSVYEILIEKFQKILGHWEQRALSLIGRILVVNVLAMSLLNHCFMNFYAPKADFFEKIKDTVVKYIWDGKKPKVKYDRLLQHYSDGGLKLCDVKIKHTALKCKWFKLITEKNAAWVCHAQNVLPLSIDTIMYANIKGKHITKIVDKKIESSIWVDIWTAWSQYYFKEVILEPEVILNEIIWCNSHICSDSLPKVFPSLINKGIIHIFDVVDFTNGKLFTFKDAQEVYNLPNNTI